MYCFTGDAAQTSGVRAVDFCFGYTVHVPSLTPVGRQRAHCCFIQVHFGAENYRRIKYLSQLSHAGHRRPCRRGDTHRRVGHHRLQT